jgi:type IV fimbrial biogenesis protein FimT
MSPLPTFPGVARQRGVTLVESLVAISVAAVLVGSAVPGLQGWRQRHQLEALATQLETDLQWARAEAVARNDGVRVAFGRDVEGGGCVLLHTGAAGDCRCDGGGATACGAGAELLRAVPIAAGSPVQVVSNSASIRFDGAFGTVTPTATVQLRAPVGSLRLIVNVMGRVRACTPDAAVPGVAAC